MPQTKRLTLAQTGGTPASSSIARAQGIRPQSGLETMGLGGWRSGSWEEEEEEEEEDRWSCGSSWAKNNTSAAPKCSPKFKLVGRKSLFHVTLLRVTLWFPQQRAKLEPRKQTSTATDQASSSSLTNSRHPAHDDTTTRQRPDRKDVCLRGSHRFRDHRKSKRKYPITTRRAISTRPGQHVFPLSSAQAHDPNTIRHEESQRCDQTRV